MLQNRALRSQLRTIGILLGFLLILLVLLAGPSAGAERETGLGLTGNNDKGESIPDKDREEAEEMADEQPGPEAHIARVNRLLAPKRAYKAVGREEGTAREGGKEETVAAGAPAGTEEPQEGDPAGGAAANDGPGDYHSPRLDKEHGGGSLEVMRESDRKGGFLAGLAAMDVNTVGFAEMKGGKAQAAFQSYPSVRSAVTSPVSAAGPGVMGANVTVLHGAGPFR